MRGIRKLAIVQRPLQHGRFGSLGQNLKFRKTSENPSLITLELFCAKNRLREHQIFEK